MKGSPRLGALTLAALGVVYGDIGTSPLYALRECFYGAHAIGATPDNVVGVVSLILWSLITIISIKYLVFVLRADNNGEGGILALMALARPAHVAARSRRYRGSVAVTLGLFGAALLYGDGMITPAISVLSAVEGLSIATPLFEPYIVPITVVILLSLFLVQKHGTQRIGAIFGPITLTWMATLALLGITHILRQPEILAAFNPLSGLRFLVEHPREDFVVLGAVFLAVTGGEALYADMGHFGRAPMRLGWFAVVFPALMLNYLGQGALLLGNPAAVEHPFYLLAPTWALYPLVALATLSTVIASQAVISGAFSLTRQAVQLGYCPRLSIEHTSSSEIGQIYVPQVNWLLMSAAVGLVLGFGSSTGLAAAYGIAVSTTMAITTLLAIVVGRERARWSLAVILPLGLFFLTIDGVFLTANALKVASGGWFPLVVAFGIYTVMSTWKEGRHVLRERLRERELPLDEFVESIRENPPVRVPGTAVFLTGNPEGVPPALIQNLQHNRVLHEQVVLLSIMTEKVPYVAEKDRIEVIPLGPGLYRLIGQYGFMQTPNAPALMKQAVLSGLPAPASDVSYFLGRESIVATDRPGMARWRERLFVLFSRNALPATAFFQIPSNQVVELGVQVDL